MSGVIQFAVWRRSIDAFIRWTRYNPTVLPGRNNPTHRAAESVEIGNGSRLAQWRESRELCMPDAAGRKDQAIALNTFLRVDRPISLIRSDLLISGLPGASDFGAPDSDSYPG